MDDKTLQRFRSALSQHRDTLLEWLDCDASLKQTHLGGMAESEALQILSQLQDALGQIEAGDFGKCTQCEGEVEVDRLEVDYTTRVCLGHYSEEQIAALERDLELAAKVQKQLLPRTVPALPGVDIACHFEPAHAVGGDYYDFFPYCDGVQGIAIADVMGKGIAASMLMSNLQASLRILGPEHDAPDEIVQRLNDLFCNNLRLIRFISIFLAAIEVDKGTITYSNAGHHPPLLWQGASQQIHWLKPTGPAVGLSSQPRFQSRAVPFNLGDSLLLYTDGLVEARNADNEEFGEERLVAFVSNHADDQSDAFLKNLWQELLAFSERPHDDVALVYLRRN